MQKTRIYLVITFLIILIGCNTRQKCKPSRRNIVDAVFASGYIITQHHYAVTAQNEGYLFRAFVAEGDSVFMHQTLFQLDNQIQMAVVQGSQAQYQTALSQNAAESNVLAQLESRLKQTNAKYVADSINFSRYGKLIGCNAVSKLEYDYAKLSMEHSKQDWLYTQKLIQETKANLNLNLAKAKSELTAQQLNLAHQTLVSNNAGVVIKVLKSEGDWVRKGETLAEIATGDYIAKLLIAEDDINKLEIGQRVYVELNTHRDHAYEALLTKIYTYFDTKEQSFVAEARFLKPIGSLKSLTQLQANIVIGERKHALVVPAQYIVNDSAVSCKSGVKKVRLGIKAGGWVEILQGLADEDTLILPN